MEISPKICIFVSAIHVQVKSVPRTRPLFRISGQLIRAIGTLDTFLNHHFGTTGTFKSSLFNLRKLMPEQFQKSAVKISWKVQYSEDLFTVHCCHTLGTWPYGPQNNQKDLEYKSTHWQSIYSCQSGMARLRLQFPWTLSNRFTFSKIHDQVTPILI